MTKRQSGEPYITHPLNVAYILVSMHADRDKICAGLLHDTLEDTHITKDDFNRAYSSSTYNHEELLAMLKYSGEQEKKCNEKNIKKLYLK